MPSRDYYIDEKNISAEVTTQKIFMSLSTVPCNFELTDVVYRVEILNLNMLNMAIKA